MTRHSRVLNTIEPWPYILINPADLRALDMESGDLLAIESRRGRLSVATRVDEGMQPGVVMMPFTYNEAAANLITNDALDPFGKIPEFKFCAIRVGKKLVYPGLVPGSLIKNCHTCCCDIMRHKFIQVPNQ